MMIENLDPQSNPRPQMAGTAVERVVQVERLQGRMAEVVADQMSACKGCAQQQSCGQATLSGLRKPLHLTVLNTLDAKAGEWVIVALPSSNLFRAMGLAYGVPLAGFMAGGLIGAGYSDAVAIGLAVVGLGVGFFMSRKWVATSGPAIPTMVRRTMAPGSDCEQTEEGM